MKTKILSFILLLLCSCTTTMYVQNANNVDYTEPLAKIEFNKIICIVVPSDGTFDGNVYYGSGGYVQNTFTAYLQPFASKVIPVAQESYETDSKLWGAKYIIRPIITHWEPRAASWSGKATRVEMYVSVFDLEQDKNIINTNLSVKGRSFTFTDQSAEELARSLIIQFITDITR